MEVLREEMLQEGLGSLWVRYLGDNQVLLTSQDGAKLSEIIETSNESLSRIFEAIQPWSAGTAVGNKIVWTRCRGLPLHLWTVDCFKKILWTVGTLVDVDEATLNWEQVEYARLKVRLAMASKVQICEEIMINGTLYQISVEEEFTYEDSENLKCWFKEDTNSVMSLAMDTMVGDSLQSGDERWANVEELHGLKEALEDDGGQNLSGHPVSGEDLNRSYAVDQPFLETNQRLIGVNKGKCKGSEGKEIFVQQQAKVVNGSEVDGNCTLVEGNHLIWAKSQRIYEKSEPSPSRLLFHADLRWACKVGIGGHAISGPKAHCQYKEIVSPCNSNVDNSSVRSSSDGAVGDVRGYVASPSKGGALPHGEVRRPEFEERRPEYVALEGSLEIVLLDGVVGGGAGSNPYSAACRQEHQARRGCWQ